MNIKKQYTLADYNKAVLSRQEVLLNLSYLMPKDLPYDWLRISFHYTLLEDMVILCCSDPFSRSVLLKSSNLKNTSLKSNTFWKHVRQITGLRRTLHSIVSRYRSYWENLHPKELVKFIAYLEDRKYDHIIRLRRDNHDLLVYVESITTGFFRTQMKPPSLKKTLLLLPQEHCKTEKQESSIPEAKTVRIGRIQRIGKFKLSRTNSFKKRSKYKQKQKEQIHQQELASSKEEDSEEIFANGTIGTFQEINQPDDQLEQLNVKLEEQSKEKQEIIDYLPKDFIKEKNIILNLQQTNVNGIYTKTLQNWVIEKERYLSKLKMILREELTNVEKQSEEIARIAIQIQKLQI